MTNKVPETQHAYVFTQYGGTENQEHRDIAVPVPGSSELLVRVHAAGVNPVDWKVRAGYLRPDLDPPLPLPLGREVSGVVVAVGRDVDGFVEGDEVFGNVAPVSGGWAEYALLTAAESAAKPPAVSWEDAATLSVAACTARDALVQLGLEAGQVLLVNGIAGGVGVVAAQFARDQGLTVIGTASADDKALAESLGAVHVTYGEGVVDRIREMFPQGVDGVLDLAGGDGLRSVTPLVSSPRSIVTTADPGTAAEIGAAVVERDPSTTVLAEVAALLADGKFSPMVREVFPLSEAEAALAAVEVGHAHGKVVIRVS